LLSLKTKSQNLSSEQLANKRNQITRQIQKTIDEHSSLPMKKNTDFVKKKMSETLKLFKELLEDKYAKRDKEYEQQIQKLKGQEPTKYISSNAKSPRPDLRSEVDELIS